MDDAVPHERVRMADLPVQDLPREKLARLGRSALSDEELIAIFLRTGVPGCNVLELAGRLKRAAGSLAALGAMEAEDIARLLGDGKGVGKAKAATLAAVFELGQRAVKEQVSAEAIATPAQVYEYLSGDLRFESQENMVALLLDSQHKLLRRINVGVGTLTRVMVHPRDVFSPAVRYKASCLILAHNHPSGDPRPSSADRQLTEELKKAADVLRLRILDHVIIGAPAPNRKKPYYSFADDGLLP